MIEEPTSSEQSRQPPTATRGVVLNSVTKGPLMPTENNLQRTEGKSVPNDEGSENFYKKAFRNLSLEQLEKGLNDMVLKCREREKAKLPQDKENLLKITSAFNVLQEKFSKTLENLSLEELGQKKTELEKERKLGQHSGLAGEEMHSELSLAINKKREDVQVKKLNIVYQNYSPEQIKNKIGEIEETNARAVIDGTPIDHDVFLRFLYRLLHSNKNGKT